MPEWVTAEWITGMPVILVKSTGRKVVAKIPVGASAEDVPAGPGALLWAMVKVLQ